jgi:DNA-binding MarR family transcriptional regulator
MKKEISNDKEYDLWVVTDHYWIAMFAARERELRKYGISAMQAEVLYIVDRIGKEATPAEIARWLLRRAHSVSGLLQRMEKDGLIVKTKDLSRKNMVRVTITDKGQKALKQSLKRESIKRVASVLPEEDREQLYGYMKKLRDKAAKVAKINHSLTFP